MRSASANFSPGRWSRSSSRTLYRRVQRGGDLLALALDAAEDDHVHVVRAMLAGQEIRARRRAADRGGHDPRRPDP